MSEPAKPLTQECSACGALIDVSAAEPMALMHCPACGVAMRVRRHFGNFELLEILGAGGMGAVYRAFDARLNRAVALKLLRREYSEKPEFIKQFEHEASVTAVVNHPNVVKVYSTGSDHGLFYIAMELVDQGSLDELMALQKKISEAQVLEVGIQIGLGLRAAFKSDLIHRDVKPGNILFANAHHAKIVDFGLAARIDKANEVAGEIWGTPYYVAPEKLDTPFSEDFRSDIYSLGATLFHALAGRPPYEAEDASLVALKHLKSQPVSLQTFAPHVSAPTAYVINRTLAKEPDDRYSSYGEFIQHLEYARAQLALNPPAPLEERPVHRVVLESLNLQRGLALITLCTLLAIGTGGWLVFHYRAQLFPAKVKPAPAAAAKVAQSEEKELKPVYDDARQKLLAGNYGEALAGFREVSGAKTVPQPLRDWATLHAGLVCLLAGKLDDAHADFQKLASLGSFSPDPFDEEFASFMTALSNRMLDDEPVPLAEAQKLNVGSYECIGLLLYGLKNWELGEFEIAQSILHEFALVHPEEPDDWIAEYQVVPERYGVAYARFREFSKDVLALTDAAKARASLPRLKGALPQLGFSGALERKAKGLVRKAQTLIDDEEAEEKAAQQEMESADERSLADDKAKGDALGAQWKFREALGQVRNTVVLSPKGKKEKQALIKRYDWLVSFKAQLIQDIGAHPFPGSVARKSGAVFAGQIFDADEQNILVKAGPATASIPWADAAVDSIVLLARTNLRADMPADRLGDRAWYLGVYCVFAGKAADAAPYFQVAVSKKPEYGTFRALFPEVPGGAEPAPAPAP